MQPAIPETRTRRRARCVAARALWAVVMLGWPAVAALKLALHPAWGGDLSVIAAPAEAACALALRARMVLARRRKRERRAQDAERRLRELETRVSGLCDTLDKAVRYAQAMPEPRRLRAVRQDGAT